jgi:hypothetical protein
MNKLKYLGLCLGLAVIIEGAEDYTVIGAMNPIEWRFVAEAITKNTSFVEQINRARISGKTNDYLRKFDLNPGELKDALELARSRHPSDSARFLVSCRIEADFTAVAISLAQPGGSQMLFAKTLGSDWILLKELSMIHDPTPRPVSHVMIRVSETNFLTLPTLIKRAAEKIDRNTVVRSRDLANPTLIVDPNGVTTIEFTSTSASVLWRMPVLPSGEFGPLTSNRFTPGKPLEMTVEEFMNKKK